MKLSHRIPVTPWRATTTWGLRPVMLVPLLGGLGLFGLGEGLLVQSQWGATPWTVLAEGISRHTHWSLGWSTAVLSGAVLLCWWPLGERLGLGTLANLVVIAYVLDLVSTNVALAQGDLDKALYSVGAVAAIGMGSALYLTTGLGPGPRDGLMTSVHRRLHVSVVYVRAALEASVLLVGWLLGGRWGIATVFFALTIGFSLGASLRVVSRLSQRWSHD